MDNGHDTSPLVVSRWVAVVLIGALFVSLVAAVGVVPVSADEPESAVASSEGDTIESAASGAERRSVRREQPHTAIGPPQVEGNESMNRLVINATGGQERSFYSFEVSGVINPEKVNAHDTVSYRRAEGYVGAEGKDVYRFSGTITEFDFDGPARVYLNGEEVDPDEIPRRSTSMTPTVPGTTSPLPVTAADLTTYANERYAYSIQRPESWEFLRPRPESIFLSDAPSVSAAENYLQIAVSSTERSYSVAELNVSLTQILTNGSNDFERVNQRTITLSSGQQALVIDARFDYTYDTAGPLRGKYLAVSTDSRIYIVQLAFAQRQYTADLNEVANTIIESFTLGAIGDAGTRTQTPIPTATDTPITASMPTPTSTPPPTLMPTPTSTPPPTLTPTPTSTPTATATSTQTPTATRSANPTPSDTTTTTTTGEIADTGTADGEATGTTDGSGPGFTLAGAVGALLALALLAVRRR